MHAYKIDTQVYYCTILKKIQLFFDQKFSMFYFIPTQIACLKQIELMMMHWPVNFLTQPLEKALAEKATS